MMRTRPSFPNETPQQTAIKAIEAFQANPQTTYTPRNIIDDFGPEILDALRNANETR